MGNRKNRRRGKQRSTQGALPPADPQLPVQDQPPVVETTPQRPGLLSRPYLRFTIRQQYAVAATLTIMGLAALYGLKNPSLPPQLPLCHEFGFNAPLGFTLMANVTNPRATSIKAISLSIQQSLNDTLEKAMGFDASIIKETQTGKVVGRVAGGRIIAAPNVKLDPSHLPDDKKLHFIVSENRQERPIVVSDTARFVIADDLSFITIGNERINTPLLPGIAQKMLGGSISMYEILPMPIKYVSKGAVYPCPSNMPLPKQQQPGVRI
jgi:hypothetical protein